MKQPNHLQTMIVDVDGGRHLTKFSRYFDNPGFWTVPGQRDERLHGRKKTTVTEPEPDEVYDLTLDPTEHRLLNGAGAPVGVAGNEHSLLNASRPQPVAGRLQGAHDGLSGAGRALANARQFRAKGSFALLIIRCG